MKKQILLLALATVGAQAATQVTLYNFSGVTRGLPIVDNAGNAVAPGSTTLQVGTFSNEFITGLAGLNTETDDQLVIDSFISAGPPIIFVPSASGLFNNSTDVDNTGSLGTTGRPLYALITYAPTGATPQAMVLNFGSLFPVQNDVGQAAYDPNRLVQLSDVVFGSKELVSVNLDSLPAPFRKAEFSMGLTFDGAVIPEPSTGLLAGLAGLALLARRRR